MTTAQARRYQLLEGKFVVRNQIVNLVGKSFRKKIEAFGQALWLSFVKNGGSVSATYWSDKFKNQKAFNRLLMHLSRSGWVVSTVVPTRNWGEVKLNRAKVLEYITQDELTDIRTHKKFEHYKLGSEFSTEANNTRLNGEIQDTGISRPGTARLCASMFSYDTDMLIEYQDIIELNVSKSMRKLKVKFPDFYDKVDYEEVSKHIVQYHIDSNKQFCLGSNVNDARGRAIADALKKVFNPIGYKDARALLVIPEDKRVVLKQKHLQAVYLFIAELLGIKASSKANKIQAGKEAYKEYTLHELDYSTESGRSSAHENIWLQRLYNELDNHMSTKSHKWSVPIETDSTASMLQIDGTLLNHKPFLDGTNVINEDSLKDIWAVNGLSRDQFKKPTTRMLYGSSASAKDVWKKLKIPFKPTDVKTYNKIVNSGEFAPAILLKDFIIGSVEPQETMQVKIWGEEFTIQCNKYRSVGEYSKQYNLYNTASDSILTIFHVHTKRVPDLTQFKLYFRTLLNHNLDSQVADYVAQGMSWGFTIYDAFICCPSEADSVVRKRYSHIMEKMSQDRKSILSEYFQSIGIKQTSPAWLKLMSKVVPLKEPLVVSSMALK